MGRPAKWRSTRKLVAFAPTTMTTTIDPDGALVLLPDRRVPESGEGLSLRRSTRRRQHLKHHSRVRSYRFSKVPNAQLRVEVAARAPSPAMHLPAIFESPVCKGGNERMKRAPPPGLSAMLTLPPCARMISLTMARPRPAPTFFSPPPRQNRLKMFS